MQFSTQSLPYSKLQDIHNLFCGWPVNCILSPALRGRRDETPNVIRHSKLAGPSAQVSEVFSFQGANAEQQIGSHLVHWNFGCI